MSNKQPLFSIGGQSVLAQPPLPAHGATRRAAPCVCVCVLSSISRFLFSKKKKNLSFSPPSRTLSLKLSSIPFSTSRRRSIPAAAGENRRFPAPVVHISAHTTSSTEGIQHSHASAWSPWRRLCTAPSATSCFGPMLPWLWSSTLAAHGRHGRGLLWCMRKKQNRITQMDEAAAVGQRLNQEQKEVMRSKPTFTAIIDQLVRLHARRSPCFRSERLPPRRVPGLWPS